MELAPVSLKTGPRLKGEFSIFFEQGDVHTTALRTCVRVGSCNYQFWSEVAMNGVSRLRLRQQNSRHQPDTGTERIPQR